MSPSASPASPEPGLRRGTLGALALITGLCYAPALLGPFVLDDVLLVLENPRFGDLGAVLRFFVEPVEAYLPGGTQNSYYRPLSFLTLWIDRQVWGNSAGGFHLTNLILHLLSTLLVFRLARRWFGDNETLALGVAALWSVIPLHAETVSYIAARHDVLFLVLYLLALDVYTGGVGPRRQILFAILATASFMAKEMAISLPLIAGLHDLLKPDRGAWFSFRRLGHLVCPVLTLGLLFGIRIAVVGSATGSSPGIPDPVLIGSVGWHYLKMLVSPFAYSVDRSRDVLVGIGPALAFTAVAGVAIVTSVFILQRRGNDTQRRCFAFGILGALATYLPVSHVVPLYTLCADRYLYLPLFPLVLAIAAVISTFVTFESRASSHQSKRQHFVVVVVFLLLATSCLWRSSAFTSEQRLYETSLEVSPQSPLLHNNLGKVFARRGNAQLAAIHFGAALTAAPNYSEAQYNLGAVALQHRDFEMAEKMFGAYLATDRTRGDADAWRRWGLTALETGQQEDARIRLGNAERLQPGHPATKALLDRIAD
jgi:Tfp pilus assembly protein PilF